MAGDFCWYCFYRMGDNIVHWLVLAVGPIMIFLRGFSAGFSACVLFVSQVLQFALEHKLEKQQNMHVRCELVVCLYLALTKCPLVALPSPYDR